MPDIEWTELNLPDNLRPWEIKAKVTEYANKHGIRHLWWNIKQDIQNTRSGYTVCDYTEYGDNRTSVSTHYTTREEAEIALQELDAKPGGVLVHVIEEDWSSYRDGVQTSLVDVDFLAGQLEDFGRRIARMEMMWSVMAVVIKRHEIDLVEDVKALQEVYQDMEDDKGTSMVGTLQTLLDELLGGGRS